MLKSLIFAFLLAACYVAAEKYADCIKNSILFYEAQRSGDLPSSNRIPWRRDSTMNDKDGSHDLTGGWFDAGDYVKFNFPMAFATTFLAWGILDFKAGYQAAGQYSYALNQIKWPLDYLLKCHTSSDVFYAQVGNGDADHDYYGRPEQMTINRPAYKIDRNNAGSDLAAEAASAMAAGYLVFKSSTNTAAIALLAHKAGINFNMGSLTNKAWAKKQIDLLLGQGGRSYVVGYGTNPPKKPHHRARSQILKQVN